MSRAKMEKDIKFLLQLQSNKEKRIKTPYEIRLFKNNFTSKINTLHKNGKQAEVDRNIERVVELANELGLKPVFTKSHRIFEMHSNPAEAKAMIGKKVEKQVEPESKKSLIDLAKEIEKDYSKVDTIPIEDLYYLKLDMYRDADVNSGKYEKVVDIPQDLYILIKDAIESRKVDELVALKKKLYPNPDIESAMSEDEKNLNELIAEKYSKINSDIKDKRKAEPVNEKQKIIDYLISKGNNPTDAEQMVNSQYEYITETYPDSTISKKAEVIRSLWADDNTAEQATTEAEGEQEISLSHNAQHEYDKFLKDGRPYFVDTTNSENMRPIKELLAAGLIKKTGEYKKGYQHYIRSDVEDAAEVNLKEQATIEVEGDIAMQEAEQEFKEGNTVGSIRPDFMDTSVLLGKEITLSMPNGEKRRAQFAIAELGAIRASHNEENFHSTEGYPKSASGNNINDRNYTDDTSAQMAVLDYARDLEPERLITTSRTPSGTPIITADGFVVSGNNRTMSLKLAANDYPQNFKNYVQFLSEEIESFGFDRITATALLMQDSIPLPGSSYNEPKKVKFTHPVLVRVDYDFKEYTTQELAKYNKDTKKSERPIDKAIKLSNILRDNPRCATIIAQTTGDYDTFTEFYAATGSEKKLAGDLVDCNLLTMQELPSYFTGAAFTATGKEFIENLLASLILNREALIASEIPGVKGMKQKLITSLPILMKNANLPEGSLKDNINNAVLMQQKIKASGSTFADFIRQQTMFGEKYDRKTAYLNRLLDSGKFKFKKAIEGYNESVTQNQGASLFGEKPSLEEIFNHHIKGAVEEQEQKLIEGSNMVDKPTKQPEMEQEKPKLKPYIAFYNQSKHELYAESLNDARNRAVAYFKPSPKNQHLVSVHLADDEGEGPSLEWYKDELQKVEKLLSKPTFFGTGMEERAGELKAKIKELEGQEQPISQEAQDIIKPEWDKMQEFISEPEGKEYKYYMLYRPFDIGTYPPQWFLRYEPYQPGTGAPVHGTVIYSQKLEPATWKKYDLFPITELKDIVEKEYKNEYYERIVLKIVGTSGVQVDQFEKYNDSEPVDMQMLNARDVIENINSGYWKEIDHTAPIVVDASKPEIKEDLKVTPADFQFLRKFVGDNQIEALMANIRGEEGNYFRKMIRDLIERIKSMPGTYETSKVAPDEKIVYLHYFSGGSDWYIVEKDKGDSPANEQKAGLSVGGQYQAFGYAILNGDTQNAEWGYISIVELIQNNIELDLYWEPKAFGDIVEKKPQEKDGKEQSRAWFGYSFEFKPVNKEGKALRDALTDRGVEWIMQPLDGQGINVAKVMYKGTEFSFFDNSGEFKVDGPDEMIGTIYFTNNGEKRPISELADEIVEVLDSYVGELPEIAEPEDIKEMEGPTIVDEISLNQSDYKNAYVLNKAIEKKLDQKWNDTLDQWSEDELLFLKKYSGDGGLKEEALAEGHSLDAGVLYEFYTPKQIIQKMWDLARHYGYDFGPVVEPSSGIGSFFDSPSVKDYIVKYAFEPNKYSAKICKLLYPEVDMNKGAESMYFEQLFLKNNASVKNKVAPIAQLVIGNPPYGKIGGEYITRGEEGYSNARSWVDYFIFRGLDLLEPGGLLIYIIGAEIGNGGTPWLDQNDSKCKQAIAQKADLIDAYRLPADVFDRTKVVADIVVFEKK